MPWRAALAVLIALAAGGCGSGGDDAPREERPAATGPRIPAAMAATCEKIAGDSEIPVLCPPPGESGGPLEIVHEDLDPEPCGYLVNLEAPVAERDGPGPSHAVIGGACLPLPVDVPAGRPWPPEPPSLRLVANPPLESGRQPRITRPDVLRPVEVRGQPGLLMQSKPGTEGGFHGSHYELVWNEGGAGYTVSLHWASGDRGRPPAPEQVEILQGVADSLSPAR
jgi:hypothetical protein